MNPLSPGDVVEIETDAGLAYVQVTHRHSAYPEVIRAFPGRHSTRPGDLGRVTAAEPAFIALAPLSEIVARGALRASHVGSAPIPDDARAFPTFRTPIRDRRGEVAYWWLWDGEGLRYDANPGPEIETFPVREVLGARDLMAKLNGV